MSKRDRNSPLDGMSGSAVWTILAEALKVGGEAYSRRGEERFDLYTLGLGAMPETQEGLRVAWHATARRLHPQYGGDPKAFSDAKNAYDRLTKTMATRARWASEAAARAATKPPTASPVTPMDTVQRAVDDAHARVADAMDAAHAEIAETMDSVRESPATSRAASAPTAPDTAPMTAESTWRKYAVPALVCLAWVQFVANIVLFILLALRK